MFDRADEDEAHLAAGAGRGDEVHQLQQFAAEFGGAVVGAVASRVRVEDGVVLAVGQVVQAGGHAVAQDRHGRLHDGELFLEAVDALGHGIEAGARGAQRAVAAVAEVAHGEVPARELAAHLGLEVAKVVFALDEHVADEQDAVAVLERELGVGEDGERAGQEAGQQRERA